MKKLFNMDNPFWTAMGRVFDIFVLNCLWLLCCLPVFTIGPATTALFYGMFGILRETAAIRPETSSNLLS